MEKLHQQLRVITAYAVYPFLKVSGFRFSKDYRYGTTLFHRLVYSLVSTPKANLLAGLD